MFSTVGMCEQAVAAFTKVHGLLTKCEVKMAGYWPSAFLLYGFWGNFSCGTRRVVPRGQDGSILPARVANHNAGFDSSCPLAELAI